jgi:hypothetical protein
MEIIRQLCDLIVAEWVLRDGSSCGSEWRQAQVVEVFGDLLRVYRCFRYHRVHLVMDGWRARRGVLGFSS